MEVYCFAINNIGTYNNSLCNYIKVVVISNTNNVISIYPVIAVEDNNINFLEYEYDYDLLFKKDNRVKKYSQIDKFKKRYNL